MLRGYIYVIIAASFWGCSAVLGKYLINRGVADAILLSQARVTVSWLVLLTWSLVFARDRLRIKLADWWRFALLGTIGVAGANFLLYFAVGKMDTALADLIQFTAPAMVALWMVFTKQERFKKRKILALGLSLAGCELALGVFQSGRAINALGVISAGSSAICYAFLIIFGKSLSRRYPMVTYLQYGFLAAVIFWFFVVPPWRLASSIGNLETLGILLFFSCTSVLLPYLFFFSGLKRVPAGSAGIVSTWEPVVVTMAAWGFLGETLGLLQLIGILLVCVAIGLVEAGE